MQLVLQDNAYNGILLKEACIVESNADYQSIYNDLSYIANKNVKELLGENSLIYFGKEKTEIEQILYLSYHRLLLIMV